MKKLFLPLLLATFIIGCEQESPIDQVSADYTYENGSNTEGNKVDVCHNGRIINVSVNAVPAHQGHGDAVDMDGDGYFDIENDCSETDCDDSDYNIENNCETCVDEAVLEFCPQFYTDFLCRLDYSNACYEYRNNGNTLFLIVDGIGLTGIQIGIGDPCSNALENLWITTLPECD